MFKKIGFDVAAILILGGIITALFLSSDEMFDKVLYGFLFSLPLLGFFYRLVRILIGEDMSTNGLLERSIEIIDIEAKKKADEEGDFS